MATSPAWAAIDDYEFELAQTEVQVGEATVVSVRLVDKRTGEAVPDAVIFEQRVDMAPDGMETMAGSIEPLRSTEPGIYSFETGLVMQGGWRLSLAAKIQGEEGTLESQLEFRVLP
nr:FixH family protein [Devosia psychrophila]